MNIKLKHIRRERDGRVYYRRHGRSIRLRRPPGTPGFLDEYRAAERQIGESRRPPGNPQKTQHGSLRWLVVEYQKRCPEFKRYSFSTQRRRRNILDALCTQHGHKPYTRLETRHIRAWRDAKADTPAAANETVKALKGLFKWAVELGHADRNPAADVPQIRTATAGHHTWTIDEVKQFELYHPVGSTARLALAILLYTGLRRSDAIGLGRQHARAGWHTIRTSKTGAVVEQPILPALQEAIDAAREAGNLGDTVYLKTQYGRPWTNNAFGNAFRRWCDEAGLPKHCSAHGLRKAGAVIAAENGATEQQLMAIFGWESPRQAALYTRAANRRRLAEGVKLIYMRSRK